MVVFLVPLLLLWVQRLYLAKISLEKINFKIKTGAREIHKVFWWGDFAQVKKSSNVSDPEIIHQAKIKNYENNDLFVSSVFIFKSVNPALWLKEGGDDGPLVAPIYGMSSKATYYLAALHQIRIAQNTPEKI